MPVINTIKLTKVNEGIPFKVGDVLKRTTEYPAESAQTVGECTDESGTKHPLSQHGADYGLFDGEDQIFYVFVKAPFWLQEFIGIPIWILIILAILILAVIWYFFLR